MAMKAPKQGVKKQRVKKAIKAMKKMKAVKRKEMHEVDRPRPQASPRVFVDRCASWCEGSLLFAGRTRAGYRLQLVTPKSVANRFGHML